MQQGGKKVNKSRISLVIILIILILALVGVGVWWFILKDKIPGFLERDDTEYSEPIYSNLTGLELVSASLNDSPTFCVQIPNGSTDGARPQVGLHMAGVVFEAIAETGITRFAAVFQNPDISVIGPIRSLRPYYLSWDTPFDCTVVHDGGSAEALAEVGNGNYRNLDEDFNYMWKETYIQGQYRYWNNVFTSPSKLIAFNRTKGYGASRPKTFPRLKPDEVAEILQENKCDSESRECNTTNERVTHIRTAFTNLPDYIVNYTYDVETNTYLRSYEGTGAHMSYHCAVGNDNLNDCNLTQVAPTSVAIMRVQESTMSDGYHEEIRTIGSGVAYVFQNGTVTEATWRKSSQASQIEFRDLAGNEIKFTPGQLWIAAVPQFGSVSWE